MNILSYACQCPNVGVVPSAFNGHEPFLYAIIRQFKPETYVELGSYTGCSTRAAAEAMQRNGKGKVFALDAWGGDTHMGKFSDSVFELFKNNINAYSNITIKRGWFSDSAREFDAETIDVLLIDGQHDYESVSQDFATWISKVKPGGLVLFHDSAESENGFGVMKFVTELQDQYDIFQFYHSHGLAVLQNSGTHPNIPTGLVATLNGNVAFAASLAMANYGTILKRLQTLERKVDRGLSHRITKQVRRLLGRRNP